MERVDGWVDGRVGGWVGGGAKRAYAIREKDDAMGGGVHHDAIGLEIMNDFPPEFSPPISPLNVCKPSPSLLNHNVFFHS